MKAISLILLIMSGALSVFSLCLFVYICIVGDLVSGVVFFTNFFTMTTLFILCLFVFVEGNTEKSR